jgi:hypothetical protein
MDNIPINTNFNNEFEENVLNMFGQTSNVSNRAQNRYLDTLYDTVSHYNQNMRLYNSNMQNIISILQHMQYSQTRSSWNNSSPVYTGRTQAAGGGSTRAAGGGSTRAAGGGSTRAAGGGSTRAAGGGSTRAAGGGSTRNRSGTTSSVGNGARASSSSRFPLSNSLQRPINRPEFNNYSLNDIASDNSLLFTYMFQPESGVNQNAPFSADEISRYTSTYSCTPAVFSDISGNRCPISLDNFQIDDVLIRINGCGHTFKRHALMRWFERSNSCPMCRRNLRESHVDASNNNVDISNNIVDASNNSIDFNTINQTFNSMIQTWVNEFQTNIEHSLPASHPHPQPVSQPQPEPVSQPQPEPVSQPQPEPVSQPQPEPVSQPQPEPVSQPQSETDSDDDIEPDLSVD